MSYLASIPGLCFLLLIARYFCGGFLHAHQKYTTHNFKKYCETGANAMQLLAYWPKANVSIKTFHKEVLGFNRKFSFNIMYVIVDQDLKAVKCFKVPCLLFLFRVQGLNNG